MGSFKHLSLFLGAFTLSLACMAAPANKIDGTDVVAIVSTKSPVTALSREQIVDIFMANTPQLPYEVRLVPVDQLESSAARDKFYAKFAGRSPAQMKSHWSKIIFTGRGQPPKEVSSSTLARELVANNPNAIGYIEKSMVDASVRALDLP
jgi:hypothetical protein